MRVSRFIFNMFGENTYVIWDPASREAAIVDPGMIDEEEEKALDSFIEREGLKVTHLVNTHMHLDHIFGNNYVGRRYGVRVEAHPDDDFLGRTLGEQGARFGLLSDDPDSGVDVPLRGGDSFKLGEEEVKVIHVPGHSPGGIALYCPESGFVLTGDSVFRGSVGRTDLPGGNMHTLVSAVRKGILSLPPNTVILPGHGDETTVGAELRSNPYLQ